jgi:DNA topoisomerase VI subunit A
MVVAGVVDPSLRLPAAVTPADDTPLLLRRIENVIHQLVDGLAEGRDLELSLSLCRTHPVATKRLRHLSQARSLTSIILVLAYCHALYPKSATTREVYYYYITHFKSQRECDTAIVDACRVLGQLPRHRLGLHASSRGWYAGPIIVGRRHGTTTNDNHNNRTETTALSSSASAPPQPQPYDDHDGSTTTSCWEARPITADWLRHFPLPVVAAATTTSTGTTAAPRCLLLVEKEGIFQRLLEDGGIPGCIIVTGKGFPDLATRALVWTIHHHLPTLPIYGLADCDPFGVSVLHCYHTPPNVDHEQAPDHQQRTTTTTGPDSDNNDSNNKNDHHMKTMVEGQLPIQWLGLRPSQYAHLDFPDAVFQALTARDQQRLDTLLSDTHPFCDYAPADAQQQQRRADELTAMRETKVELEALHWLGMEFCTEFVTQLVEYNLQRHENKNKNKNTTATSTAATGTKNDADDDDDDTGWMEAI